MLLSVIHRWKTEANPHNNNNKQAPLVLVFQVQLQVMDALSVVTQLRDLASEPQNRAVIVQDEGCLPGLVLFLDHQSHDVLLATLQVSGGSWNHFQKKDKT